MYWNAKMPINRSGSRMVPIRNDLLLTIASNSRFATAYDLDMCGSDFANDVFGSANLFQEHLLEGGLAELEALDAHPGLHERHKQLLRIGVWVEHHVCVRAGLAHAGDQRRTAQKLDVFL